MYSSIILASRRNTSKKQEKYRLKFLHGAKNKDYVFLAQQSCACTHKQFKGYVLSPPFFDSRRNTYSSQTVFTSQFNLYRDLFSIRQREPTKKGTGSCFLYNEIFPLTVEYWFMDDGGVSLTTRIVYARVYY